MVVQTVGFWYVCSFFGFAFAFVVVLVIALAALVVAAPTVPPLTKVSVNDAAPASLAAVFTSGEVPV